MRVFSIILFLGFTITANAQSISFSPTSVPLWGSLEKTIKGSVEYQDVELVGVYSGYTMYDNVDEEGNLTEKSRSYSGYFIGAFYTPLNYDWRDFTGACGVGIWNRRFPTSNGQRVNFTVQLEYQVGNHLSLQYSHFSNGFGILNQLNPGLDNIGLAVHF